MPNPPPAPLAPPRPAGPADTWRWLPGVAAVLVAAAAVAAAAAGLPETARELGGALADGALSLVVLAPLLAWALYRKPGAWRVVLVLVVLVACSRWALFLPRVGVFAELEWNWQGKTLELLWLAALFAVVWPWARDEAGLGWRVRPGSGAAVARVIAVVFAVAGGLTYWALADSGAAASPLSAERLLFDAGHANLTEELLVRGAMLALLDRICGTPWRFFGAQVGWGLVITSLLFGLWHGLAVSGGLSLDAGAIVSTGIAGLLIGWVRARSGSVWLAYAAHCAPELGANAAQMAWAVTAGAAPVA